MMSSVTKQRLKRVTCVLGGATLTVALSVGLYLGMLQLTGNFHSVVSNVLYRSAQPNPHDIARYQKAFGIRTIVNLRGQNHGRDWYDVEVARSKELGIAHIDFAMSAERELSDQQAETLIGILVAAQKPVLIHCRAGADRSGLAAALYIAAVAKLGEDAAEAQISLRYGHISLPVARAYAMDRSWEALESWLGFPNS